MRPDHYATLGVAPGASAADIRASYLALLREHHPDRSTSPDAADRTREIVTAFKVLGDFDQRSYYDWDRRRDREAAAAEAAAVGPRRVRRIGWAAGGLGLAAAGAWMLMPVADPERNEPLARTAASAPDAVPAPVQPVVAKPIAVIEKQAVLAGVVKPKAVERVAAEEVDAPRVRKPVAPPETRVSANVPIPRPTVAEVPPVRVAAKVPLPALPKPARPAARPATDLASLDQFVMNFYGQSWRYGDAPKRAALEQTRAGFVARRGACAAEQCKREAYLKLMRDVSAIVETGKPR